MGSLYALGADEGVLNAAWGRVAFCYILLYEVLIKLLVWNCCFKEIDSYAHAWMASDVILRTQ